MKSGVCLTSESVLKSPSSRCAVAPRVCLSMESTPSGCRASSFDSTPAPVVTTCGHSMASAARTAAMRQWESCVWEDMLCGIALQGWSGEVEGLIVRDTVFRGCRTGMDVRGGELGRTLLRRRRTTVLMECHQRLPGCAVTSRACAPFSTTIPSPGASSTVSGSTAQARASGRAM